VSLIFKLSQPQYGYRYSKLVQELNLTDVCIKPIFNFLQQNHSEKSPYLMFAYSSMYYLILNCNWLIT